ncbi:alpha/beta-hydrolase [Byssothecium circinans]|uniref:Alpha/beta-hydrolase n=1 Tax=Byssothecium circinans TaxID=147558 RepID=A0A6A5TGP3_9PLEO|nr:alpha/beta-hydrolase [Byssothecium circinans]
MKLSLTLFSLVLCASTAVAANSPHKRNVFDRVKPKMEKRVAGQSFKYPELQKRASRFLTDKTKGSSPQQLHETLMKLWFGKMHNSAEHTPANTIRLNGGPGCSSLSGLLTENGPFTWEAGTQAPVQNPYSWTNLTNMIWIEQPIGVGFTQGTPNITDEVELATEFRGFWKNFISTFGMEKFDMYITVVILPYVEYWNNLLYLNDSFLEEARVRQAQCNYDTYWDKYFKFPPPAGPQSVLPDPYNSQDYACDQFDNFYSAILEVNPCFNIYHITETCPHPFSQLGIVNTGDYQPPNSVVYFNRTDVQEALHAVVGTNWLQCSDVNVFGNGNASSNAQDASKRPANTGALQRVIEYTNNTIIGSGDLDMLLSTNGTLLAIQNMTWNGLQGLQEYPSTPLYAPYHPEYNGGALAGSGVQGKWSQERGLTFYTAQLAGHELPGYTPGVAYPCIRSTANSTLDSDNSHLPAPPQRLSLSAMDGQPSVQVSDPATSLPASEPSLPLLFQLPDELLLCIAAKVAKNSDLRQLALVNRKLRTIAQEALAKEAILPRNGIVRLLRTLCEREDLAQKIKSADLGEYQVPTTRHGSETMDERLSIFSLDRANLFRRLRSSVDNTGGNGLFARIVGAIGKEPSELWTPSRRYFLDILVALAPNLKELAIELPRRRDHVPSQLQVLLNDSTDPFYDLVDPFKGPGLQLLRHKLRVLTLSPATHKGFWTHNVTLRPLAQLVHLSIPMDALVYPTLEGTDPVKALPASLKCIQVRPCNQNLVYWIPGFAKVFFEGYFTKLCRLEFVYSACIRSNLLLLDRGSNCIPSFRNLLYCLKEKGLTFPTLHQDGTSAGDLIEELTAWSCLSDSEAWWAAMKGMQFSDAVAKTDSGNPRRRTSAETRLFLRGTETPVKLRSICRFDPQVSLAPTSTVKFGKDKEPKFVKENCKFGLEEWAEVLEFYKISPPDVVMVDDRLPLTLPSLEQVELISTSKAADFSRPFGIPQANSPASKFNAEEWLELEFFPKAIATPSNASTAHHSKKRYRANSVPVAVGRRSRTPPARRMKQKVE